MYYILPNKNIHQVGDCPEVEVICDTRPTSEPSGEPTPMPTPEPSPEPIRKPILPLDEIQLRVLNSRAVTPTRAKKRLRRTFGAELDVKSLPNISLQIRAESEYNERMVMEMIIIMMLR